jgi:hypothetical protein
MSTIKHAMQSLISDCFGGVEQSLNLLLLPVLELDALQEMPDLQGFLPILAHLILTDDPLSWDALAPVVQIGKVPYVLLHCRCDLPVHASILNGVLHQIGLQLHVRSNVAVDAGAEALELGLLRTVFNLVVGLDLLAFLARILAV